jgi:CO/xanthine dehydrogenase FAD-binding subunit
MRPFVYERVTDWAAATQAARGPDAVPASYLAGGTTLVDLM